MKDAMECMNCQNLEGRIDALKDELFELQEERDAFRDEANAVRRIVGAEIRDLEQRIDAAEAVLKRARNEYPGPLIVLSKENPALAAALMSIESALTALRRAALPPDRREDT